MTFEMPPEIEAIAEKHLSGQPSGGIITIREERELAQLIPTMDYKGEKWIATRRRIDQLDQVTFGRIRS